MKAIKKRKKRVKERKINILVIIFFILLTVLVASPTLSSYKNRLLSQSITVWDGTIADSYRSGDGSKDNPYIIANGAELAYFASQLQTTSYEGKNFKLSNNVVLNEGLFSYDENEVIKYLKDNAENIITPNQNNNLINKIQHLNNFKGTFDGDYYTIFGVYIDEPNEDGQNALFTNLEGTIKNLYIENSIIYGGKIISGVASKTNNATLTNVLYDGFVISDKESSNNIIEKNLENITLNSQGIELNNNLTMNDLDYVPGLITEITLSGNYTTDNDDGILKINGQTINTGNFEINLGSSILTTIPLNYQSNIVSSISITNLKYQIKYNYSNAAGIISIAENTTLQNVINKGSISGSIYASGIINFATGTTKLNNVYNTGKVNSNNISTGLISGINQNKQETIIINSYNNGKLNSSNSSMIGNLEYNLGNITLENIFNPQDNYTINLIEESKVLIKNSYVVTSNPINIGTTTDGFIQTIKENLENKTFIQTNLQYVEFKEDETNIDSAWIYLDNSHPKLFIDYSKANINIGDYKWNEYKKELKKINFPKKIVVSVSPTNELNNIKEIYYYISNSEESLTKTELSEITTWEKYENIIEINNEGKYIIYAKIISTDNSITYLNSDLITLDFTGSNVTISTELEDTLWETLKEELSTYYIDNELNILINAEDSLSGIKEIYYYTTNEILTLDELENLENWYQYQENILINAKKTIVYVKVIDNCNNITYINSDYIVMNGYTLDSLYPGMNGEVVDNLYITKNSSVSLNFSYQDVTEYKGVHKHQLISNVLLPEKTIITIIDKINNKVYKYTTTSNNYGYDKCSNNNCYATYDFELFDEVGTTKKFKESNYTGTIDEHFLINIDFKNTEITEDIENIKVSLNLYNNEEENKNTIQSTIKTFNVKVSNDATFTLTSQFEDTIKYNENKQYIIDFNTKLNYKYLGEHKIYDTTFEDKQLGLSIKLLSPNGNVVEKTYLKNILFQIGNKKYTPSSDGIVRINLNKGLNDVTDNLTIQTSNDNSKLETGNYKFEISLYTAYDGMYSNEYLTKIEIPVYVGENTYKNDIHFNVEMNNEDKIISTTNNEFNFKFLLNDDITEKYNIKISLYKRNSLLATDQKYNVIDLGSYLKNNSLEKYKDNIYYASKDVKNNDEFNINLDTSLLEKKGYMFVFDLYKNDEHKAKITKKFIVK